MRNLYLYILGYLAVLFSIFRVPELAAQVRIQTTPNAENPQKILLENDSLFMQINMDWQLSVPVLKYKPLNINFIQSDNPMPVVHIDNPCILNTVGFAIRTATIEQKQASAIVNIKARSNYIENPFILRIRLSRAEVSENKKGSC